MSTLSALGRNQLEKVIIQARDVAESAAQKALQMLAVAEREPWPTMSPEERRLRIQLRAVERRLGSSDALKHACAYEHWHRMLFARFLAESGFLIHPDYCVPVTLEECAELARGAGESDRWTVASRFAAHMLPGIFPQDDPLLEVRLPIEDRLRLEGLLESLPVEVFTSDDGLGWTYQFWQSTKKEQAQSANKAYYADDIPAVTQLFTERYMVEFLLQNTLGAWWLSVHPDSPMRAEWHYYRPEVEHDFSAWPDRAVEVRVIDPCCGSGHFLVEAFQMLWRMRVEEGESPSEVAAGILRDNLFGLELDARCVQIAAFALAMAAWKAGYPVHDALPIPNVACCGLPLGASPDEWRGVANGNTWLADALSGLHGCFSSAQELGSLVDPVKIASGNLSAVEPDELLRHLGQALTRERNVADPVAKVFGGFARGALRAFRILTGKYHLAVTNPPFVLRGKQSDLLKDYCSSQFPEAKKDLATCFVERCRAFTIPGGYYALVNPQNWLFLTTDKAFRSALLRQQRWLVVARLGSRAFETIGGEVVKVALLAFADTPPNQNSELLGLDASDRQRPKDKAEILRSGDGLMLSQAAQFQTSDTVIVFDRHYSRHRLGEYVMARGGITTGDSPRFRRCFWELQEASEDYALQQATVSASVPYGGRSHVLYWERGRGELVGCANGRGATIAGRDAWGKKGVAISYTKNLQATLYTGELYENIICVLIPRNPLHLPAVWAFCASQCFASSVRKINQKLSVDVRYFEKVDFDLGHWQAEAEKAGPLPEPYSDDPTQWLFKGNVKGSSSPLQVAVARLLGYKWPEQPEEDELTAFVDPDGIVCLPAVLGKPPAVDRLRALLATDYGSDWSMVVEESLLASVGYAGKGLEAWLRDAFFEQHTKLFHNRPFIWHVWDGRKDGFSALINYHTLDRARLDKFIYSYLGAWIAKQRREAADEVPGADARIVAAEDLKKRLELISIGETPYDVYVRWKPIDKQPVRWDPDLNDGVRLNIRPFVTAGVLRSKVTVSWGKDRGRDPDGSERINDRHLTLKEKRDARSAGK